PTVHGPETAAADLVRVSFARDGVGYVRSAWMGRRGAAGKAGDRHIEAAPEKMHGARLAEKARAELLEHPIHIDEHAPELLRLAPIISRVGAVLLKRDGVGELDRDRPDRDLQPQRLQPV